MTVRSIHVVKTPASAEPSEEKKNEDLAKVMRLLEGLQSRGLFGRLVISMQAGKVTQVQIEQTVKIDEL